MKVMKKTVNLLLPNGDKYIGGMENNFMEGFGILILSSGDIYKGEFKKNKYNGYGIYLTKDGIKVEGQFKDGKVEGYGIYNDSEGNKYEGDWKMVNLMELEFLIIQLEKCMKENLKMMKKME